MRPEDLQSYKKRLLELRDRSRDEINRMVEVVLDDAQPAGEHDRKVSEAVDKEVILENTEEAIHKDALAALQRIDAGTFGSCETCGEQISKPRLDALPFTRFCVNCEREREK